MSRDFKQFSDDLKNSSKKLDDYFGYDAPRIAGIEAVSHFEKSFQDEGFTRSYFKKWLR